MVVGVMVIFSIVMAYESWKQSRLGREIKLLSAPQHSGSDHANPLPPLHA
jgi:hypothetical protein